MTLHAERLVSSRQKHNDENGEFSAWIAPDCHYSDNVVWKGEPDPV